MTQKIFFFLAAVFLFALLIRVINLGSLPNGFEKDEAYLGYNAYSILKTGKDISGNLLPLHLSSFLYTPAGYSYFSIPFIAVFGLNEFSVRFASALFGAFSIVVVFLFTFSLLSFKDNPLISKKNSLYISFLASLLLALTPWHINMSRTASVVTLVVFFVLLGMYLMIRWIEHKEQKLLLLSFISFLLTLFFYIASYTFVPLLIALTVFIFRKHLDKQDFKRVSILYLLLIIPIIVTFLSPTLSTRIRSLNLINHPEMQLVLIDDINRDGVAGAKYAETRAFHNKVVLLGELFLKNYFKHLSFEFLFTDQTFPMRYKIPHQGVLYLAFIPFLVLGSIFLVIKKHPLAFLLFGWILLSPLGSSFASDDIPNIQRTLTMVLPLIIIVSIGVYYYYYFIMQKFGVIGKLLISFAVVGFLFNIYYFFHSYTIHMVSYRPWYRQEGYKEMIVAVNDGLHFFKKAVITNREATPTIFLLFYNKYDPQKAQEAIINSKLKDTDRISFANYEITEEECPLKNREDKNGNISLTGEKDVLYVNSGLCKIEEIDKNVTIHKTIKRSDGSIVFYVLSLK